MLISEWYMAEGVPWDKAVEAAQAPGTTEPDEPKQQHVAVRGQKSEEQIVAENNAFVKNLMAGLGQSNFRGTG